MTIWDELKTRINLLDVCSKDTQLNKVATTEGGEYAGPCPFCGGTKRFKVQPYHKPYGRWFCRDCNPPPGGSVIDFAEKKLNRQIVSKEDTEYIIDWLKQWTPGFEYTSFDIEQDHPRFTPPPKPAKIAPSEDWQKSAEKIIFNCQDRLWNDPKAQKALDYLRNRRGLTDKTIEEFRLGYAPDETKDIDFPGIYIAGKFVRNGITIPCITAGEIWYIKIRKPTKPGDKDNYAHVKGASPAIFNGDWMRGSSVALFTEGEFNAMIAHQELNQYLPCVSMGSASNTLDLAVWYWYFTPLKKIIAVYDNDEAGENGFKRLQELAGSRVHRYHVPGVKDINDLFSTGADLFDWLKHGINEYLTEGMQK